MSTRVDWALLGPKYDGDKITLTVDRDGKTETFKDVTLGGISATISQPFLGILPMRDDPEPGVEVRYVYPKSPADLAGIQEGDRIMKFGPSAAPMLTPITTGRTQLSQIVRAAPSGAALGAFRRCKPLVVNDTTARLAPWSALKATPAYVQVIH